MIVCYTMKEIVETLHLPVGDEAVRRFLIKQGYTYKKKSLHVKEQERPRCAEKTQLMHRDYIWCIGCLNMVSYMESK